MNVLKIIKKKHANKVNVFYFIGIFLGLLLVDQYFKWISLSLLKGGSSSALLGFSFELFQNPYWVLGFQLTSNPFLSFVILLGLFCTGIYLYLFISYYFSFLKNSLHLALAFLFSGMMSNILERLKSGYVMDFISYQLGSYSLHFNSSDLLQTIGWLFIIYILISYRKQIWVSFEKRNTLLIMKKQQLEFIGYITGTVLYISIFSLILNHQFLKYFERSGLVENSVLTHYSSHYVIIILIAMTLPILIISIYFSNKIYGPIYAFDRYIKDLINNKKPKDLKLRKNDILKKELESLATKIKNKIEKS
ncbi:MAG: signal peptidase II [Bdellovibrionales bacterium]